MKKEFTLKGFTLIELLVTIAIISLLSSIVFASLSSARERAIVTKAKTQGKEVEKAIELSRLSNGTLPVNIDMSLSIEEVPEVNNELLKYISEIPDVDSTISSVGDQGVHYISDGEWASYIEPDYISYLRCGPPSAEDVYPDDFITYFLAEENDELNKSFFKVYKTTDDYYGEPDNWINNVNVDAELYDYSQWIIDEGGMDVFIATFWEEAFERGEIGPCSPTEPGGIPVCSVEFISLYCIK